MTLIASPRTASQLTGGQRSITTYELGLVVRRVASEPRLWRPKLRPDRHEIQLAAPAGAEVWLRLWLPGQRSGLRDDGAALSAFAIVDGALDEIRADDVLGVFSTLLQAPAVRVVEHGVVYDLHNAQARPAVTIHAYAPGLDRSAAPAKDLAAPA